MRQHIGHCAVGIVKPASLQMFDDVPVRVWLLLLIAIIAWMPTRYVLRHVRQSPARRDITQPPEDLNWRSSSALAKNVAILIGLAGFTAFIFTPAAAEFARSPSFLPILLSGLGGVALWSVTKGYVSGVIEPMVRGARWEFTRAEHPKRYWASMGWNGLLGAAMLFFGVQQLIEAPTQALRDRCFDWDNERSAKDEIASCNRLLAEHPRDGRSDVIAARGSAYYRMGDYRRAGADYAEAIRLDAEDSFSHYNLGLVHERLGNRQRAAADYGAAIRIDPKNTEALINRGLIHLNAGRLDDAIADFTRAHEVQPSNIVPLANRGVAYAWKKDIIHAEQDLAAVRKRQPSHLVLLHGEALLAMNRGDMINGVRFLSDAIARDPRDTWAFTMRAQAYRILGEVGKMHSDTAAVRRIENEKGRTAVN